MIKINLVGEGKKIVAQKKKSGPKLSSVKLGGEQAGNYAMGAVIALVLVAALGYGLWLKRAQAKLQEEINVAQRRVDELQAILDQVEEFKRKEIELQTKIDVISDLKNNQKGPVRIMDQLSKALPDLLWYDRFDLMGNQVTVNGRAFSSSAIANFAENVTLVPYFQEPVGPDFSQSGEVYNFNMRFTFDPTATNTKSDEEVAAEAAAAAANAETDEAADGELEPEI